MPYYIYTTSMVKILIRECILLQMKVAIAHYKVDNYMIEIIVRGWITNKGIYTFVDEKLLYPIIN